MATQDELSKDDFLQLAKVAGLDTSDTTHMEELFGYVQTTLQGLSSIKDMDLTDVEPEMVYLPGRE